MKIVSETAYQAEIRELVDQAVAPLVAKNKSLVHTAKAVRSALASNQRKADTWRMARMFMRPGASDYDIATDPWQSGGAQFAGNMTPGQRSQLASMAAAAGRSLYLRDPHASMAVELYVMFGIGNGLNYAFELPVKDQDRFMEAWNEWWFSNQASIGLNMQGSAIDRMNVRNEKGQGEGIIRYHACFDDYQKGRRALPLGIETMQTTRIDRAVNEPWNQDARTYTKDGIRYNGNGAIQGIHLFPIEPGDGWSKSEYVPMWDDRIGQQLILYYDPKQSGLTRGADNGGLLAYDIALQSSDLRSEAARQQRMAARRGGAITTDDDGTQEFTDDAEFEIPEGAVVGDDGSVYDAETGVVLHESVTGRTAEPDFEQIGAMASRSFADPGAIMTLPQGWTFNEAEPIDAPAYAPLQLDMQMAIATAWKVPYAWLSGDASKGNMSSNKGVVQPFQKEVEWMQENYINCVASVTARNAIIAANSVGIVRTGANGRIPAKLYKILGNIFPSTQPDKDARVAIMNWANLATTFDEYVISQGKDPKKHREALKADLAFYKELGIYEFGVPATISPQFTSDFMAAGPTETAAPDPATGPSA